jgi:hypothetical protein
MTPLPLALEFFRLGNHIEAGFWGLVALGLVVAALKREGDVRRRCWIAAGTFFLFGWSDVIEARTGAWYRPIWLLLWKALCLVVIAWLLLGYERMRRGQR